VVEAPSGSTYDGDVTDSGDSSTDPPSTAAKDGDSPAKVAAPRDELPLAVAHGHGADEPPLARAVRRVDDAVGHTERVLLFGAFAVLILTGLYRTFADKALHERPLWAVELMRLSAFAIGMLGAAYATQNRRNFGLDLVSALMSTRFKAITRVFTNLAAAVAAGLLFYGGRLIQEALAKEKQHYEIIPLTVVGWFIPVCALLIMFHVLCHMVIEIDYLRQGKTAPEPEVVG
jgi:TRAP-type C4-dicarboxylate transport system permease small subunit